MSDKTIHLKDSFKQFKRLLLLIKPYWGRLSKGMSLGVVTGLIGMAIPYLTKLLIDEVYPSQDITLMHILVGGILAVYITSALIRSIQGYLIFFINSKISNETRLLFFNHLQHLKIRFYDEHRVGEIMSRFSDIDKSLNTINKIFQTVFVNGVYLIFVPAFLLLLQWKLALVALISLPLTITIIALTGKYIRKYWKKSSEAFADLNAFQFEILTHIRVIKSMVLEHYVYKKNKKQLENAFDIQLKAGGLGYLLGFSNELLYGLNIALFTWLGWTYILSNEMSLGDYIAFTAYLGYLYRPLSEFVNLFSEFQQSSVSINRMFEYLDIPTELPPSKAYKPHRKINHYLTGDIEIDNLSFSYNSDDPVLRNINLKIKPNSVVSIVGPSGSGKTTLLRLLTNMETPQSGSITFDGKSISDIPIPELREQISVIWQEFSMFKGTINDNLTIGLNDIDEKILKSAIEISGMDELISSLPNGINTPIAEWGASLSGGQRQRLAIARAIIRNSPILIFDEATSNIDMTTEKEILNDLLKELNDKTIIFVTHRLSTAKLADKVCFIEDGKIVGFGTHNELIKRCKKYKQMYAIEENNQPNFDN